MSSDHLMGACASVSSADADLRPRHDDNQHRKRWETDMSMTVSRKETHVRLYLSKYLNWVISAEVIELYNVFPAVTDVCDRLEAAAGDACFPRGLYPLVVISGVRFGAFRGCRQRVTPTARHHHFRRRVLSALTDLAGEGVNQFPNGADFKV